jgi:predicted DNA-binding ribbon-helix-helix protein
MSKTVVSSEAPVTDRSPAHRAANSPVIKRSIIRNGHKSSVSLEDQFWDGLREIADLKHMTVSALVATIDHGPNRRNLSSAIRVFVLGPFQTQQPRSEAAGQWTSSGCSGNYRACTGRPDASLPSLVIREAIVSAERILDLRPTRSAGIHLSRLTTADAPRADAAFVGFEPRGW